ALRGVAAAEEAAGATFEGWMELIGMIEELLGGPNHVGAGPSHRQRWGPAHTALDETRWVSGSEASPPSWTYAGINLATVDYAGINLATQDLHGTFEQLQAGDAEVVQ